MKTPTRSILLHKLHHQFALSRSQNVSNPMQQFSSHGAVARFCATALIGWKPYPLSGQGFYGSPIARRKLRGVSPSPFVVCGVLFVTQRHDGIKSGGFVRGIEAKEDANY